MAPLLTLLYKKLFPAISPFRRMGGFFAACALLLCCAFFPAPALAANSGGVADKPYPGDYTGSVDGVTTTSSGGTVTINNDVTGYISGGYSESVSGTASTTNNSVIINGSTKNKASGGYSASVSGTASATGNSMTINGGEVTGFVNGGYSTSDSGTASTAHNRVNVNEGKTSRVYGGYSTSDRGTAKAAYNSVTINGSEVTGGLYGGQSESNSGTASTTSNSVTINGGKVTAGVAGGDSLNYGSGSASATGNRVVISGNNMTDLAFGGHSHSISGAASATHNSVTISGGEVTIGVYGGFSSSTSGTASATHNTVTLMGAPVFGADSFLFGGYVNVNGTPTGDARTGNTLNVFTSGIAVNTIKNFQHYNFAFLQDNRTALTLTGTGTDVAAFQSGDVVRVPYAQPGQTLEVGHSNILLRTATDMTGLDTAGLLPNGQARQGVSLIYDYTLDKDANSIWATVTGMGVNPQAKALTQSRAASLAFANLGADLIAGAGMDSVRGAAASYSGLSNGPDSGSGLIPFFAVQGSSLRYNSGSRTDVDGAALMTGLAKKWEAPGMDILAGVFFEAAIGSTSGTGGTKGEGDTRTLGGGILARLDMTDTLLKGLYAEASLRAGSLNTDYTNDDLRDFTGDGASYDANTAYYGAHAGLGYIWNITERASLDTSAKYFWTHQQGKNLNIQGDKFDFKDADSHRTRLGARFGYAVTEEVTPYIGAAWEYEFDGKARATVYGLDVPGSSLKGGTGVGELGLTWKPEEARNLAVNFGVQGYTGMREGVSGTLQLKYEF